MNPRNRMLVIIALAACWLLPESAQGVIRYVRPGGSGNQSGSTWSNASGNIQTMITASSSGDQIWIASGVYTPGANESDTFLIASADAGVQIYGGFVGNETSLAQRDWVKNVTVLSGEIGDPSVMSDNIDVVVTLNVPALPPTLLDGITVTGGNGGEINTGAGAGIFLNTNASPTIKNCRLFRNSAGNGGAIYCQTGAHPTIQDSSFDSNHSDGDGGAILIQTGTSTLPPTVQRCRFSNNIAGGSGGAIRVTGSSAPAISASRFENNISLGPNGGGALANFSSGSFTLVDCAFINNHSEGPTSGGGAATNSFGAGLGFLDCVFSRNSAVRYGGAIWNTGFGAVLTLTNCSLSANSASVGDGSSTAVGGGVRVDVNTTATLYNCILFGNISAETSTQSRQISNAGTANITYSSIEGWAGGGAGNNATDPHFVNSPTDNLRLRPDSPAMDYCDSSVLQTSTVYDLDGQGHLRRIDDPSTANNGVGPVAYVDRGAYEFDRSRDCNSNSVPDNQDIADGVADCNRNGIPDSCDIASGFSRDCQALGQTGHGVPDECDVASGTSLDINHDGIPDECPTNGFVDCNHNGINDACDLSCNGACSGITGCGQSTDCNNDGIPDECQYSQLDLLKTWTTDTDFTTSTAIDRLKDINVLPIGTGQTASLQRNTIAGTKPLPYLWVSSSKKDRFYRIDTAATTPAVVAEFHTAPSVAGSGPDSYPITHPERVAVDLDGSAWFANSGLNANSASSVVKVGLVVGGTRVNSLGLTDANGAYLKGPFDHCTCEDRNGDGLIYTSMGADDVRAWYNWDGADTNGGISHAEDECILRYVPLAGTGIRALAIDAANNVWTGGEGNRLYQKLDGFTGLPLGGSFSFTNLGGYGALVDCCCLWSTSHAGNKVMYFSLSDPNHTPTTPPSAIGNSFGLTLDTAGNVWTTGGIEAGTPIQEFTAGGSFVNTFTVSSLQAPEGLAIRPADNSVWIADYTHSYVVKLNSSGSQVGSPITFPDNNLSPDGVAVDSAGNVWVASQNSSIGYDATEINSSGSVINHVALPPGGSSPISIGDMTGMVSLLGNGVGSWFVVHDGIAVNRAWCRVTWNTESGCSQPANTSLEVAVRAANSQPSLADIGYSVITTSGNALSNIKGRYAQIRVRLTGSCPIAGSASPKLCDLTLYPVTPCLKGDMNGDGLVNGKDIRPFVTRLLTGSTCAAKDCAADVNSDNQVTIAGDIPCFVNVLLENRTCTDTCTISGGAELLRVSPDCNGNGVSDSTDIAELTSIDCNKNFIPDECDVNPADPDGNGLVSADIDANGVPDECQIDCDHSGVPDSWEIAQGTRADVNANGIPDICEPDCNHNGTPDNYDISQHSSADCNSNGTPDECEADCNGNHVPDDCDLASGYSPDCDADGFPDECELAYGPMIHVFDCNNNGVPDNCDIASGYSNDSNHNGIPDECESGGQSAAPVGGGGSSPDRKPSASAGFDGGGSSGGNSVDTAQGGSNENTGETPMPPDTNTGESPGPQDLDAAWEAFYEWADTQCWGLDCETTGSEQFQAYVDKLTELGLPVEGQGSIAPATNH